MVREKPTYPHYVDIETRISDRIVDHRLARTQTRAASLAVVVPTLNEERNISWVLGRIPAEASEVIMVDGRSTDRTVEVALAARPDLVVLEQLGRGKGAALLTGMLRASADIVVMIDADGSMDPAEIPAMVGALYAGADLVKGSRSSSGGESRDFSPLRRLGNWGLTRTANWMYGQRWRELCYGYAAFWRDVLPVLGLADLCGALTKQYSDPEQPAPAGTGYGYGFEIEALLFCRAARSGLRIAEVFSFEHPRRNGESNLATWRDGWRVATALFRERAFTKTSEPARTNRAYPIMPALHEVD